MATALLYLLINSARPRVYTHRQDSPGKPVPQTIHTRPVTLLALLQAKNVDSPSFLLMFGPASRDYVPVGNGPSGCICRLSLLILRKFMDPHTLNSLHLPFHSGYHPTGRQLGL